MDYLELKALGKINLGLDVLGRRENGYHDVRMVMQTVYLYDKVVIKKIRKPGIEMRTNLYYLPVNENNLAYRAAKLLREEFSISDGVFISLEKHIPVAAGMAGGSSNAAAVLFGMNRLFGLRLNEKELMKRGVRLGADVPYCIMRGTVLAEGIGEILTPLRPMPRCHVLLAKPAVSVSTKAVYEKMDALEHLEHPDIDGVLEGIRKGSLDQICGCMGNVLESVTVPDHPEIEKLKELMKQGGALNAMMSGSGPTVFGIFEDKQHAKAAADKIKLSGLANQVYVTTVHQKR